MDTHNGHSNSSTIDGMIVVLLHMNIIVQSLNLYFAIFPKDTNLCIGSAFSLSRVIDKVFIVDRQAHFYLFHFYVKDDVFADVPIVLASLCFQIMPNINVFKNLTPGINLQSWA